MSDKNMRDETVILDYENRLILKVNLTNDSWIKSGAFFKVRLRRFVEFITGDIIFFKQSLSYVEYIEIQKLIEKNTINRKVKFQKTKRYDEFIESKNLYIEKRSRLGIDIKKQSSKILKQFKQFEKIVNSSMTRQLRDKQMWDAFFMFSMTKSGNFSVPGSGKTSSVLGTFAVLESEGLVDRIVMIGPKNAFSSWEEEFNICFENKKKLKLFNLHDPKYLTSNDKKRAISLESGKCNLLLFNYESVGTYQEELTNLVDSRTLLVFDEVHRVKRVVGENPGNYAKEALHISEYSKYTIVMTGTPIPNSYLDLYNMLNILFKEEYKNFFGFDVQTLKNPSDFEMEAINDSVQPFFCRTNKTELLVPPPNPDDILKVNATSDEQALFDILISKYGNNRLTLFIRLLQLESNPKMLLEQVAVDEFKYVLDIEDSPYDMDFTDYSEQIEELVNKIGTTSKMSSCIQKTLDLVQENKKVIIWCIFKDSITNISAKLSEIGVRNRMIFGDVAQDSRLNIINDFKSGEIDVLITNPHTLAESVSLHSVCHDAMYFEYSYNLVHLLQSKDRIHRLGLPEDQYTQYYYMQSMFKREGEDFSISEAIYERLHTKEEVMLKAIDNQVLEKVTSSQEDLDLIFDKLFKKKKKSEFNISQ